MKAEIKEQVFHISCLTEEINISAALFSAIPRTMSRSNSSTTFNTKVAFLWPHPATPAFLSLW